MLTLLLSVPLVSRITLVASVSVTVSFFAKHISSPSLVVISQNNEYFFLANYTNLIQLEIGAEFT